MSAIIKNKVIYYLLLILFIFVGLPLIFSLGNEIGTLIRRLLEGKIC